MTPSSGLIKTLCSGSRQGFRGASFYCRKSITLPEMLDAFRYFLSGHPQVTSLSVVLGFLSLGPWAQLLPKNLRIVSNIGRQSLRINKDSRNGRGERIGSSDLKEFLR